MVMADVAADVAGTAPPDTVVTVDTLWWALLVELTWPPKPTPDDT